MNRKIFIVLTVMILLLIVVPVSADGAMQISGTARFPVEVECDDLVTGPEGQSRDFAKLMTGDLEGCLYVFV